MTPEQVKSIIVLNASETLSTISKTLLAMSENEYYKGIEGRIHALRQIANILEELNEA